MVDLKNGDCGARLDGVGRSEGGTEVRDKGIEKG